MDASGASPTTNLQAICTVVFGLCESVNDESCGAAGLESVQDAGKSFMGRSEGKSSFFGSETSGGRSTRADRFP